MKLKTVLAAATVTLLTVTANVPISLAVNVNPAVGDISYWYGDEDIRAVLSNRLGSSAYIAPAVPNVSELINDIATEAVKAAKLGRSAVIPVNLNNNHWTALAVRLKTDGKLVIFFNDSFGSSINNVASQYVAAIVALAPDSELIDLQVHQQNDGSSCGAFTAENLVLLSNLDQSELNSDSAKALLETVKDAASIRLLQLNSLGSGVSSLYEKIVNIEQLANSEGIRSNIETICNLAISASLEAATATHDRLTHLFLAENISGFSAGDEGLNYGIWLRSSFGRGVLKESNNTAKSRSFEKSIFIGFDGKPDEDSVVGISLTKGETNLKPKIQKTSVIDGMVRSKIESIIGSLYGSTVASDSLVVSGNIAFGKLSAKTDSEFVLSGKNTLKLKGEIFGVSADVQYPREIGSFIFMPKFGLSWEQVKLSASRQTSLNIGKINISKIALIPSMSAMRVFEQERVTIIPELSLGVSYAPFVRASKLAITSDNGVLLLDKKLNVNRQSLNFGAELSLVGDVLELNIGYQQLIRGKYISGTGTLKLRVNV